MLARALGSLLFGVAILAVAAMAPACGPDIQEAVFTFPDRPDYPIESFVRGDLGVVRPKFSKRLLFVAYRHLAGVPFDGDEQAVLTSMLRPKASPPTAASPTSAGAEANVLEEWRDHEVYRPLPSAV